MVGGLLTDGDPCQITIINFGCRVATAKDAMEAIYKVYGLWLLTDGDPCNTHNNLMVILPKNKKWWHLVVGSIPDIARHTLIIIIVCIQYYNMVLLSTCTSEDSPSLTSTMDVGQVSWHESLSSLFQHQNELMTRMELGRPDHTNFRILLWKCVSGFNSDFSESRSRILVPLLLRFIKLVHTVS